MRDCLILGSGRSGTSMVAGSLARSGYFLGDDLYAARACNPKGFFEAPAINGLNEALMAPSVPAYPALGDGQRWLARLPRGARLASDPALDAALAAACARRPFAYKDPRFSWTLPAWQPHLAGAGLVCVFRHPELTARSVVEECRSADYLKSVEFGREDALAMWRDLYARVLEYRAAGTEFLFLHYDQALAGDGLAQLGAFLGAPVDATFPDRGLRRAPDLAPLDAGSAALYAELCEHAGHAPESNATSVPVGAPPRVAAVCVATDATRDRVDAAVDAALAQRGVAVELTVVDATRLQDLECERATPMRLVRRSVGATLAAIAETTDAEFVATFEPRAGALPHRLARSVSALAAAPDAAGVRCALQQTGAGGEFVAAVDPFSDPDHAWPLWDATLCVRTEALAGIDRRAFRPALLELARGFAQAGRLAQIDEGLAPADRETIAAARADVAADERQLRLEASADDGPPALTVMLAHHRRPDAVFECLESFCRQTLPPSALELIVIDDNSEQALVDELRALELPVALSVLRQGGGGAGNARNLGLPHARGQYVLFVNDDTIADPELCERHLAAHADIGSPAAVLGHFRQPTEALDNALLNLFERTTHLFGYEAFEAGADIGGSNLYTCNVSAPLDAVRSIDAFDPIFSHYGCEDTDLGLRLEDLGVPLIYRPECRAVHRHLIDERTVTRRQPMVARAHARMFAKHPRAITPWLAMDWSDESVARMRLDTAGEALEPLRRVVATLGDLDTGGVRAVGSNFGELADVLEERLDAFFERHNGALWWRGFIDGFEEQGVHRFEDLLARVPLELDGVDGPAVLLRARAGEQTWLALIERFAARKDAHDETLVVWSQADDGPTADALEQLIAPILARAAAGGREPRIACLVTDLAWAHVGRVFAACDRWLATGDPHDADDADLAAGAGAPEVDLATWSGPRPAALGTTFPWRALACPDWTSAADVAALAELAEPMMDAADACLVLARREGAAPAEPFLNELGAELDRRYGADRILEVVVHDLGPADSDSLATATSIALALPSSPAGADALASAAAVAASLDRLRTRPRPSPTTVQVREPARDWRLVSHA